MVFSRYVGFRAHSSGGNGFPQGHASGVGIYHGRACIYKRRTPTPIWHGCAEEARQMHIRQKVAGKFVLKEHKAYICKHYGMLKT